MSYLYAGTIRSWQGLALAGVSLTVYTDSAGTVEADLTDSGGTAIDNPTTTDDRGRVEVYSASPTLWYKVAGDTRVMRLVRFCDLVQGFVSGLPWFNVMDYGALGNGSHDDTDAIKAALAAAEGGQLYFPPGDYGWSATMFIPPKTTLIGVPGQSILTRIGEPSDWSAFLEMTCFSNVNWYADTDTDIHIYGLSCRWAEDSPEPHTTSGGGGFVVLHNVDRFSVDHCEAFNSNESNIFAYDCHHGTITDNYIHGFADTGIGLSDCTDVVVSNNVLVDGGDGINVYAAAAAVVNGSYTTPALSSDIIISGNTVRIMYSLGIEAGDGGSDADSSRYVVNNNAVDDCNNGIIVSGNDISVVGNVVHEPGSTGIWLHPANTTYSSRSCARISVVGNIVSGYDTDLVNKGSGILVGADYNYSAALTDVVIANNTVADAAYDGIRVRARGASAAFSHLVIEGNILSGCGRYVDAYSGSGNFYGAYLLVGSGGTLAHIAIRGNKMHDAKGTKTQRGFAIDGAGCTGFIVTGNDVDNTCYVSGSGHTIEGNIGTALGELAVTGARDDGTALASLLTQLAALGIITDSSTAT